VPTLFRRTVDLSSAQEEDPCQYQQTIMLRLEFRHVPKCTPSRNGSVMVMVNANSRPSYIVRYFMS
jgi:hypothetical protein